MTTPLMTEPAAIKLLGIPRAVFELVAAKYCPSDLEQRSFPDEMYPPGTCIARPFTVPEKRIHLALLLQESSAELNSPSASLEILNGMPKTRDDFGMMSGVFGLKSLVRVSVIADSQHGHDYGKRYNLRASARFRFSDGFDVLHYGSCWPIISDLVGIFVTQSAGIPSQLHLKEDAA